MEYYPFTNKASVKTPSLARNIISLNVLDRDDCLTQEKVSFTVANRSVDPGNSFITHLFIHDASGSINGSRVEKFIYPHVVGEIVSLHSIPNSESQFISFYRPYDPSFTKTSHCATLWSLSSDASENLHLDSVVSTEIPLGANPNVSGFAVAPQEFGSIKYAVLSSNQLETRSCQHSLTIVESDENCGQFSVSKEIPIEVPNHSRLFAPINSSGMSNLVWSPHRGCTTIGVMVDAAILGIDTRSMKSSFWLPTESLVRCADFNPSRDHLIVTGTDDGFVSIWDLRFINSNAGEAVSSLDSWLQRKNHPSKIYQWSAHNHWVWSVKFHLTKDDLILSCGGDNRICLHNFRESGKTKSGGGVISVCDDSHTDSIYACAWSPVDPWVFASVSYDGSVFVSQIPEQIKLAALLDDDIQSDQISEKHRFIEQENFSDDSAC